MLERDGGESTLRAMAGDLAAIEHALRRLDDGSYGTCEACGRPIEADRLREEPVTRSCAEHATSSTGPDLAPPRR